MIGRSWIRPFSKVMLSSLVCFMSFMGKRVHGEYKVKICRVTYNNPKEIQDSRCCLCNGSFLVKKKSVQYSDYLYYEGKFEEKFCRECFKTLRYFEGGMIGCALREKGWDGNPSNLVELSQKEGIEFSLRFLNQKLEPSICLRCGDPIEMNFIGGDTLSFVLRRCAKIDYQHIYCTKIKEYSGISFCTHEVSQFSIDPRPYSMALCNKDKFDPIYKAWKNGTSKLKLMLELKNEWDKIEK